MSSLCLSRFRGPVSAVIFDWAGTIVDYGSLAPVVAFRALFAGAGVPIDEATARGPMGRNKRDHIAGNAYDHLDEAGLLIHRYGPHIFHTNSEAVFGHLSKFTTWRDYEHRVLAEVVSPTTGQKVQVPMPINLDTINTLYGLSLTEEEVEAKVLDLVAPLLGEGAQALLAAVRGIENRQVRDLRPLLYTNELPESHP
jgi:hypothetical protein